MPYTTVAFFKDGANSTLDAIQPVADQHVTVAGDDLTVPELNQIVGVIMSGTGLSQGQLQAPSLRRVYLEDIGDLIGGGLLGSVPTCFVDRREDPLALEVSEKLNVYTIYTSDCYALINLADGPIAPVHGDIRTIKATASISASEGVWTHGTLSFAQTLPAGRYQVVGFKPIGTGVMAARLVFVGYTWRPGAPGISGISTGINRAFRMGRHGVLGEFEFDQPPSVDVLADRSITSQEFYLDLIQVRAGR